MAKNLTELFKTLVPVKDIKPQNFPELERSTAMREVAAGRVLFKRGERDADTLYVLKGEVELWPESGPVRVITGGSEAARYPLAHHQPRQVTASAKTSVTLLRIDSALLDLMLTWDQSTGCVVSEIQGDAEADGDWMTRMLQSKVFLKVPPVNIQTMFMQMEAVPVRAGEVVITQGDAGDYYYIVKRGRCKVTRRSSDHRETTLAELSVGDSFGEEALISDAPRNATVTMLTDGELMRLSKAHFVALLREPLLRWVKFERAMSLTQAGAHWLDVRTEAEHQNQLIPGSLNIPLWMLRIRAADLDPGGQYIVYCDTGSRSASAAFLLSERGFDVHVLRGGLMGLRPGQD